MVFCGAPFLFVRTYKSVLSKGGGNGCLVKDSAFSLIGVNIFYCRKSCYAEINVRNISTDILSAIERERENLQGG